MHSRSMSFFSWCFSQRPVGDCGQPVSVWCQEDDTDASRVNARLSACDDLPGTYGWRSSSPLKSLEYSFTKVRISTVSNISSGRSCTLCRKTKHAIWFIYADLLIQYKYYTLCTIYIIIIIQLNLLTIVMLLFSKMHIKRFHIKNSNLISI